MKGEGQAGVAQGAGVAVFGGILLGLAITNAFDTFFRNVGALTDYQALLGFFTASLGLHFLKLGQLVVFLFTAVRFYWGTYRYHEETQSHGLHGAHFVFGMFGAILVFSGFYVTSVYITNVVLFYGGFLLFHVFDLLWFLCLERWGGHDHALKDVSRAWIGFDIVTIVLLVACVLALIEFPQHYWVQVVTLGAVFGIGVFDLKSLWKFYTKDSWGSQAGQPGAP